MQDTIVTALRRICAVAIVGLVAACGPAAQMNIAGGVPSEYQSRPDGERTIPAVERRYLTERNKRKWVAYNGPEAVGTIVVDPYARLLYHVYKPGLAMRFGVAVGKAGLGFKGTGTIQRKVEYPSWTPTRNMIRRDPALYGPLSGGLPGGLDNPLGARALYLYRNGRDTMYRIHGTMDPSSIGKATSAGCIRLFNQDIIDMFDEVPLGTPVKVRSREESLRYEGEVHELHTGYLVPAAEIDLIAADQAAYEEGLVADAAAVDAAQHEAAVEAARVAGQN